VAESTQQVFLSYASADRERALHVADTLESAGTSVWIDRRGISGGSSWASAIATAIRESRALLVLCSQSAMASRNVRQELQLAWDHNRPILPLLLERVTFPDQIAYFLHGTQWIEVLDQEDGAWLPDLLHALAPGPTREEADLAVQFATGPKPNPVRLPAPLTALIGRDADLTRVRQLIATHRLMTLTGPGGVGKTRLAIEVARKAAPHFRDGADFIDLSSVRDASLVPGAMAAALGVREAATVPNIDRLVAALRDQHRLLLLDNFEQVLDAAPQIAALLAACPDVTVLATSRASLSTRGEAVYPVEPLPAPSDTSLDQLSTSPAVALFVERAAEARSGFALTAGNATAIAEICTRLDCLPLAIELAAARVRLLPPESLLATLGQRLRVLTGARDLPDRQRTLRDAIAWSYDLLTRDQQVLFRRMAVLAGGCTLSAAEAVCNPDGRIDLVDAIGALVDGSLVRAETGGTDVRFTMLETIRLFGLEQLGEDEEARATWRQLAGWCLRLAEAAYEACAHGSIQPQWIQRVVAEDATMRAVLDWIHQTGDADLELRLVSALSPIWYLAGRPRAVTALYSEALKVLDSVTAETRAKLLYWASMNGGDRRDYANSAALAARSLQEYLDLGDEWGIAAAEQAIGLAEMRAGHYDQVEARLHRALAGFKRTDSTDWVALAHYDLGCLASKRGDSELAEEHLEQALAISQSLNDPWGLATTLTKLGVVALERRLHALSAHRLTDALAAWQEMGLDSTDVYRWLDSVARLAEQTGHAHAAARMLGAAAAHRQRSGQLQHPDERDQSERTAAALTAALGESSFLAEVEIGKTTPLTGIVDQALSQLAALANPVQS
jgi:predicted ATPase